MSGSFASPLGQSPATFRGAKANHSVSGTTMTKGSPVDFDLSVGDSISVKECTGAQHLFAGVLRKDLVDGDQDNNVLVKSGPVAVNFKNHASAAIGTYAEVVNDQTTVGQTYFKYSAVPTRFLLMTTQTSGTSIHTADEASPPTIFVLPEDMATPRLVSQYWATPAAASTTAILTATATSTTPVTRTTFSGQPDVARQIQIQPTGTTTDVAAGDVTLTGTDINGDTVTEAITLGANQTSATVATSLRAYASITSIAFHAQDGTSATFNVGYTDALGLRFKQRVNGVLYAYLAGTREGTAPTITVNATDLSKNLVDLNSALNGTAVDIVAVKL